MKFTKKRIGLLGVGVVTAIVATWALSPLFIRTTGEQATPVSFTTLVRMGAWEGRGDGFHVASGAAKVLTDGQGRYVLRLEDFSVTNGPDIYFFLSGDRVAGNGGDVNLGKVPFTNGNYNVAIPEGTQAGDFDYVLVHCVLANFLFASAPLG